MSFESLLQRAKPLFYKVWISEATPDECQYWEDYFRQYPNKGNYNDFYNRALKKSVKVLFSNWMYETETTYRTPEEFLQIIEEEEARNAELY